MSRARDLVQSIGDGTDEILHAVASNGGNGVEFENAPLAIIAQRFEPSAVRGGVELGGDDNHRFFRQGFAEGRKLAVDDFEGVDRVVRVGIAGVDQMNKKPRTFHVAEKTDAEAGAFVSAFDEAGEIGDDKGATEFRAVPTGASVGVDDAEIGFKRGEGIVGDFWARGRNDGNQSGFARIGEAHESDIREEF